MALRDRVLASGVASSPTLGVAIAGSVTASSPKCDRAGRAEPLGRDPRDVALRRTLDTRGQSAASCCRTSSSARRERRAGSGSGTKPQRHGARRGARRDRGTTGATSSAASAITPSASSAPTWPRRSCGPVGSPRRSVHRARAALLERRVVKERVRVRVDELVRQRRRLDRVAREHRDLAALELLHQLLQRWPRSPSPRRGNRGSSRNTSG